MTTVASLQVSSVATNAFASGPGCEKPDSFPAQGLSAVKLPGSRTTSPSRTARPALLPPYSPPPSYNSAVGHKPVAAVLTDADGVQFDSEGVVNDVVAAQSTRYGAPMTTEQAVGLFAGKNLMQKMAIINGMLADAGKPGLPAHFEKETCDLQLVALTKTTTIAGAEHALETFRTSGMPIRMVTNAKTDQTGIKLGVTGFDRFFPADRIHTRDDVPPGRGKPNPDLYLLGAKAQGVTPQQCVVLEDSVDGVKAAKAAEMACVGYAPDHSGQKLLDAGATVIIRNMADAPKAVNALSLMKGWVARQRVAKQNDQV